MAGLVSETNFQIHLGYASKEQICTTTCEGKSVLAVLNSRTQRPREKPAVIETQLNVQVEITANSFGQNWN